MGARRRDQRHPRGHLAGGITRWELRKYVESKGALGSYPTRLNLIYIARWMGVSPWELQERALTDSGPDWIAWASLAMEYEGPLTQRQESP